MEDAKPMQIDGNMGTVQAVIEMLLQSHNDEIILLPALPASWNKGDFRGLVARGNVVVDAWWDAGRLTRARVTPRNDGEYVIVTGSGYCLQVMNGTELHDMEGRFQVRLRKNETYIINRDGQFI